MQKTRSVLRRIQLRIETSVAARQARARSLELAKVLPFKRVLVICYGNIYRSPLVATCLRKRLEGLADCEIRSAGFHDPGGRLTPPEFVSMALDRAGIDLSSHNSRVVTADDLDWADAILIMDRINWHALARSGADCESKVVWLGAFGSSEACDIPDPYGQPGSAVEGIVNRLLEATTGLVSHILSTRQVS